MASFRFLISFVLKLAHHPTPCITELFHAVRRSCSPVSPDSIGGEWWTYVESAFAFGIESSWFTQQELDVGLIDSVMARY